MPSANLKPNQNAVIAQHHTLIGNVELGSENCLAIGQTLADFEILGVVGEGGFGIVYLAFDHSLRRTVAIKEYMPVALARRGKGRSVVLRSAKHEEAFNAGLKSYINEARLLAQFDHPALVKVYRFWEENSTAYMAMQFYDGHTLKHIIESEPELVTQDWLKGMLGPILAALDTLYGAQILHRDISPENIIIQKNGAPVLLDFGSARQVLSGMPQSLTVVLKPSYAPIEQYADDVSMQQGPWTDIYALSAVIYKAIAKKTPPSSVTRMIQDPIETLVSVGYPGYTTDFLTAIDQGLAVLPKNRPQSIAQFRSQLGIEAVESVPPPPALVRPKIVAGASTPNVKTVPFALLVAAGDNPVEEETRDVASRISEKRQIESEQGKSRPPRIERHAPRSSSGESRHRSKKSSSSAKPAQPPAERPRWHYVAAAGVLLTGLVGAMSLSRGDKAPPERAAIKTMERTTPASAVAAPRVQNVSTAPEPVAPVTVQKSAGLAAAESGTDARKAGSEKNPEDKLASSKPAKLPETGGAAADSRTPTQLKLAATLDPQETVVGEKDAAAMGTVRLAIKPWGTLYVNGAQKGVSPPLKKLQLAEGKYKIKIKNPNFPDYVTEIAVAKKKTVAIQHDFAAADKTNH